MSGRRREETDQLRYRRYHVLRRLGLSVADASHALSPSKFAERLATLNVSADEFADLTRPAERVRNPTRRNLLIRRRYHELRHAGASAVEAAKAARGCFVAAELMRKLKGVVR